jgi:hypothetical protein
MANLAFADINWDEVEVVTQVPATALETKQEQQAKHQTD